MRTLYAVALLFTATAIHACKEAGEDEDEDTNASDECGDPDGDGGDTGDMPNVLGAWTVTFGSNIYDANTCSAPGLTADDLSEPLGGAMDIGGRIPDRLFATFSGYEAEYSGLENPLGGIVFTGVTTKAGHTLYTSFGGHLYTQPRVDRDEIRGFGYIGVDVDSEDGAIDCWIQGDWKATKSGN